MNMEEMVKKLGVDERVLKFFAGYVRTEEEVAEISAQISRLRTDLALALAREREAQKREKDAEARAHYWMRRFDEVKSRACAVSEACLAMLSKAQDEMYLPVAGIEEDIKAISKKFAPKE